MKKLLTYLLVLGICLTNPGLVLAAEDEIPSFDLNQVVVTALRVEKTDLDTPAAVTVLTKEDLKKTGTKNLMEALQFTEGLTFSGMVPGGQSWGGMNTKIIFRGVERGTLVMLNGVPLNMESKYNLEDIPLETIERVEVIRGAGTTLYGSEASGGVVNIITKKDLPPQTLLTYEAGNFGYDKKSLNWQNGQMGLTYVDEKTGKRDKFSDSKASGTDSYSYGYGGSDSKKIALSYKFNDKLNLNYSHGEKDYSVLQNYVKGVINNKVSNYDVKNNNFDLIYDDKEQQFKATAFYHDKKQIYSQVFANPTKASTEQTDKYGNLGLDLQKTWQLNTKNTLLAGFSYKRDEYKLADFAVEKINVNRNNYAFYVQDSYQANDKLTLILGGRQQLVRQNTQKNKEYNEFTPQFQSIYKINETTSWYTNVGKTFRLPNLKDLYDRDAQDDSIVKGDSSLRPEKGWNYETGLKIIKPDYSFKVSLFKINMTDYLTWVNRGTSANPAYYPVNHDFTNQGIEVDYKRKLDKKWSYSLGGSYSDPKSREENKDWQREYGRVQLTGGLQYADSRFGSSLSLNYLAQRVDPDDNSMALPDVFNVNLNCTYKVNADNRLTLSIDNLLDRENTANHKTSKYYALPFNYRLAWETKF